MQLTNADKKQNIPVGRTGYKWKTANAGNLHLTRDCCVINFIYFFKAELIFLLEFCPWSEVSVIFAYLPFCR